MKAFRWLGILILFSAPSLWAADELFELKQVVPGVYAAIAKAQYKVNCNAAVILLDDAVLVVDTHPKPSAARARQAQIKTVTDKPVKFVVNTHFHWDHYQGDQAYLDTWPKDVQIISSEG
jgi:glyoxylase-like metal-dependent hydrolase (beta-lactamase superfamily II)